MALVLWKFSNPYADASCLSHRSFTFCGRTLTINQAPDADISAQKNTHHKMWDGAFILSKFLESDYFGEGYLRGKRCVELGSGTGLVGMVAWLLGARVTLTDREDCLEVTRQNVRFNTERLCKEHPLLQSSMIDVCPLSWGMEDEAAILTGQTSGSRGRD